MTAETLRSLDARFRPSEDSGNYFIVVATRRPDLPSPSGHAFIVWGKEDSSAQLSSQVTFGFYPKDGIDAQTILGSDVPGDIVAESLESTNHQRISGRLIVQVNKEDFDKSCAYYIEHPDKHKILLDSLVVFAQRKPDTLSIKKDSIPTKKDSSISH